MFPRAQVLSVLCILIGHANLQAGLNLNIFGALSGVFSGKSKKETAADGSSVEHRDDKAAVKGESRNRV